MPKMEVEFSAEKLKIIYNFAFYLVFAFLAP